MGIARCNRPLEHAPTLCRIALQPIAALEIGGAQGLSCMQIAGLDSALKPDAPPHRIAWDALAAQVDLAELGHRSEEHTSELQALMRNTYADICLKKKKTDREAVTKQ